MNQIQKVQIQTGETEQQNPAITGHTEQGFEMKQSEVIMTQRPPIRDKTRFNVIRI